MTAALVQIKSLNLPGKTAGKVEINMDQPKIV